MGEMPIKDKGRESQNRERPWTLLTPLKQSERKKKWTARTSDQKTVLEKSQPGWSDFLEQMLT